MSLVWVSDPCSSRKLVKSSVAKNTHARTRRRLVTEYQHAQKSIQILQQGEKLQATDGFIDSCHHGTVVPFVTSSIAESSHDQLLHPATSFEGANDYGATLLGPNCITPSPCRDPFDSWAVPMSNFEYSLVSYYIHDLILLGIDPGNLRPYQHALLKDWFPIAIGDPGMLMAVFLCACRNLHVRTGLKEYYWGKLQYKGACLRYLAGSIATAPKMARDRAESIKWDVTICTMLQLASDELAAGDSAAWKSHIDAVVHMVKLNGGLENIRGMNGFLRRMIEALASKDRLQVRDITFDGDNAAKLYTLEDLFSKCFFGQ